MPAKIEFSAKETKKIIKLYSSGSSVNSIAKDLGVSHTPVNALLKKNGVNTTDYGRGNKSIVFNPKQIMDIVRRYNSGLGESPVELGNRYGCSYATIKRVLKEEGVHSSDPNVKNRLYFSEDDENTILSMYENGVSAKSISKHFGCNDGKILKILRSSGIDTTDYGRGKTRQPVPWKGFTTTCRSLTYRIFKDYKDLIDSDHASKRYPAYHIDHKLSISSGAELGLTVLDLAHPVNLQLLKANENLSKYKSSSICKRSLLNEIKEWNRTYGDPFSLISMDIDYAYRYGRYRYFGGEYTHFKVKK